ncbi:DsbA family protein [Ferrovibrio xuzhouensis]|uniref:DsbA family protein n=1 Tax=Ferrovibrio xuzhouensis TaxID=1576914 RepID=A0ABV7VJJ9_9PROT
MPPFRFLSAAVAVLALSLALLAARPAAAQQTSFTPAQKTAIEAMIRDYLVKNPEVLVEAMHALDAKQQAGAAAASRAAIAASHKDLFEDAASYVAGNPKGDVTIVEFFDYRCPYCKQMQPHIQALLKEDGKLRLVLKELPVLGPESVIASRAAVAALQQGKGSKYMAFHDAMMAFRGQLSDTEIFRMAGEAGLDVAKLKTDMQTPKVEAVLRDNLALADRLGIQGTPAFVIGTELAPGAVSLDSLRQMVKAARS